MKNTGISYRWHAHYEGKTFIVYAPNKNEAETKVHKHTGSADAACKVRPSGHYDYATNTIVDAQDGPTLIVDERVSGLA